MQFSFDIRQDRLQMEFEISNSGSSGSSKVIAKEFATVYTAGLTGTVGNLEEVDE